MYERFFARWKPHILTDQNRVRVQAAKKLQKKRFPNTFFNIDTVDETWVHYCEQVRKLGNKKCKLNTFSYHLTLQQAK